MKLTSILTLISAIVLSLGCTPKENIVRETSVPQDQEAIVTSRDILSSENELKREIDEYLEIHADEISSLLSRYKLGALCDDSDRSNLEDCITTFTKLAEKAEKLSTKFYSEIEKAVKRGEISTASCSIGACEPPLKEPYETKYRDASSLQQLANIAKKAVQYYQSFGASSKK